MKQSLLRSRSLASKREFDSMLQLLNSHCTTIRHQLERDAAAGVLFFAPPPPDPLGSLKIISFGKEQQDGRPAKRIMCEATTSSEFGPDLFGYEGPCPRPRRKPGRPRVRKLDEDAGYGAFLSLEPVYRPTMQFPPADWIPPDPPADTNGISLGCPPSESGESKRRHTRYKTLDYEEAALDRVEAWKPEGDAVMQQLAVYRQWEVRMTLRYGAEWERDIGRAETGTPFE